MIVINYSKTYKEIKKQIDIDEKVSKKTNIIRQDHYNQKPRYGKQLSLQYGLTKPK